MTIIERYETYVLVATGIGSGQYRAHAHELTPLLQLSSGCEECKTCGGMLIRDGKCLICPMCGEGSGHCA